MKIGDKVKVKDAACYHIYHWLSNEKKKPLYIIDFSNEEENELVYVSDNPQSTMKESELIWKEDLEILH